MRNWQPKYQTNNNKPQNVPFEFSSQYKYNNITESVMNSITHQKISVKGCEMHPQISKRCRKCQQIQNQQAHAQNKKQVLQIQQNFPQALRWNTANFKSHINQKLQRNIQDSYLFKSKLRSIMVVKQLVGSLTEDQISLDAYIGGTTDTPTQFMMYFYRLIELRPTREQLSIMLKANNVNVRCLGLLFLRIFADFSIVYGCLRPSFKDNKMVSIVTVGQYAMRLLDQEQLNHGGLRLPRIPVKIQKAIDERIRKVKQKMQEAIQRERSRSRQRRQKLVQMQRKRSSSSSSSQSSSDSEESEQSEKKENKAKIKQEKAVQKNQEKDGIPEQLSLKQKIRLLSQKSKAQQKRKQLLQSYKSQQVKELDSGQDDYNQNDEIQKFNMG